MSPDYLLKMIAGQRNVLARLVSGCSVLRHAAHMPVPLSLSSLAAYGRANNGMIQQKQLPHPVPEPARVHPLMELYNARELLFSWTFREFRVRYSQSIMGAAWAVLQPLVLMVIFSLVFSLLLSVDTGGVPYPVFSYVGTLPWTLFATSITFAVPSLVSNMNLVSKIYFPREVLPISSILVGLVDFAIASALLVPMLLIFQIPITWTVLFVPVILLIQTILTAGISLFASAINVFYRDVRFVVPLALQIWMYLSPVIYPVNAVPEQWRTLYFLNPMAAIIDSYRRVLLQGQPPDWPYLGLSALVSILTLAFGYRYFKNAERQFADLI
jgi:lipopolysaccharide transport system permease protein